MNRVELNILFKEYVSKYDLHDNAIRAKYDHSLRVADISETISKSFSKDEHNVDLSWCIGLFHDIGRFKQYRLYKTFKDKLSVDHADLSVKEIKNSKIDSFFTAEEKNTIYTAIMLHNKLSLPNNLDDKYLFYCNVIRDADKVDIFRVCVEDSTSSVYGCSVNEMENSVLSQDVYAAFMQNKLIDFKICNSHVDLLVAFVAFYFGIKLKIAKQIVIDEGYIFNMMNFNFVDQGTKNLINKIKNYIKEYAY